MPHLPSLDIRDGAIDYLIDCYKDLLPSLGDYVTSPGGIVNLRQVDILLGRVGEVEEAVFRRRKEADEEQTRRKNNPRPHHDRFANSGPVQRHGADPHQSPPLPHHPPPISVSSAHSSTQSTSQHDSSSANRSAAQEFRSSMSKKRPLDEMLQSTEVVEASEVVDIVEDDPVVADEETIVAEDEDTETEGASYSASVCNSEKDAKVVSDEIKKRLKEKESALLDQYKASLEDKVRLHETGWKDR